ncbi:MAG: hypothetical protein FJX59_12935 [Alphaproteobacteria bacterium]|nr:hypothetical protein [Alphaproteobacteria bacterium]
MIRGLAVVLVTAAVSAAEAPAEISLRPQGHGEILANAKGMTLYTYAPDPKGGEPQCDEECLGELWMPLIATATSALGGDWSTVERGDKSLQWTFRGKPLYTYSLDAAPGDMFGDEMAQKWYVALKPLALPPGFSINKTPRGQLLVDQKRMSLYTGDVDAAACDADCLRTWKPVEAWWTASSTVADWSVVARPDGTRQWAYHGKPLYRFEGDFNPGEAAGVGQRGWTLVVLEPPAPMPSWVTLQKSDGGELLADANGLTLYAEDLSRVRRYGLGMALPMETPHLWKPVLATDSDKPTGPWSIIKTSSGELQWTYKGMALYTNVRDQKAGELNGIRNFDRIWKTIMTSGQVMAGAPN